ncbi:MAG: hypothetical protein IKU08_02390 [Clostridia bacterium]|nr:hypothetical protein [Clostridia bacterium]
MSDFVIYTTTENKFEFYEKNSPSKYTRISINGSIVGCNNCVGYCMFSGHPGFVTKEQRKEHDCIRKNCYYYIPKPKRHKNNGRV